MKLFFRQQDVDKRFTSFIDVNGNLKLMTMILEDSHDQLQHNSNVPMEEKKLSQRFKINGIYYVGISPQC